jgi:hypothetical protein
MSAISRYIQYNYSNYTKKSTPEENKSWLAQQFNKNIVQQHYKDSRNLLKKKVDDLFL